MQVTPNGDLVTTIVDEVPEHGHRAVHFKVPSHGHVAFTHEVALVGASDIAVIRDDAAATSQFKT